ncbi:Uncharacterised protein [Bordetella pertussis]|nr:Uncharacterised protein [Bordetella pertussis]CFO97429.1 Uncharacterised protein [Bordetella pertussis]
MKPERRQSRSTSGRGRWKYRSPPPARRLRNSSSQTCAPAWSMKFMLLLITSRWRCPALAPARSACRRSVTCVAAPKYTDPSMRSSFSWGHSGNSPGCPSSTAKWRCGSAASKPIGRMAGRAVRYR